MQRRLGAMSAAVLMFVVAACGTTVEAAEEALVSNGGVADDGFTLTPDTRSSSTVPPGTSSGPTTRPSNTDSGAGTSPAAGTDAGTAGTAAPPPGGDVPVGPTVPPTASGPVGPGVDDSTIKIGLVYNTNAGAANAAYGFAGIGQIDQKKAWELLVKHVNDTGGVAGRELVPVWYAFDELGGKRGEQLAQEACAAWTQDDEIFAAVSALGGLGPDTDTLAACLTEAGVALVDFGTGMAHRDTFERYPHLVDVGTPALDNVARSAVDDLGAQGFYDEARPGTMPVGGEIEVGLLAYDEPGFRAAADALESSLRGRGVDLAEKVFVRRAETSDQIGAEAAAIQSAALRFKERGITHVQFLMTSNAFGQFTFWQSADGLQYQPRYGLTSMDAAQALTATFESARPGGPARQFDMAVGLGWGPLRDVPRADYSGNAESAELRRCKEITAPSAGSGFDDAARAKEIIAAAFCDPLFYFVAATDAGGPTPNLDSWHRGVASISGLGSASSFLLRTERQRDAVGAARDFAYFSDCNCFHYTSETRRL